LKGAGLGARFRSDARERWRQSLAPGKEPLMGLVLIVLLVLLLLGALPAWPYSRSWGYRPTGLLGIVLIVVVVLLLTGRL
jgi:hypothetical protein